MSQLFFRRQFLIAGMAPAAAVAASAAGLNVRERGAAGDGQRMDTEVIQGAIDTCSRSGGGVVYFPAGQYLTGGVAMKSRVTLELDAGAVILGSTSLADYPNRIPALRSYTDGYVEKCLIYGEGLENIAITGRGTIDGQGAAFKGPYKVRPYLMRFVGCRNVSVSGVEIRNSPMWVQHYLACEDVDIRGIRVHSKVNGNNDGIDIDACHRVRISDCDIVSGDDAIVLKSTCDRVCRDVTVTNCTISSDCNALKLGTESNGGFENIVMSNCTVYDTRLAGIALEVVDGGRFDRVAISNIVMKGVGTPIFIRLGNRARPFIDGGPIPGMGTMRNITISGVDALATRNTGCAIAGLPGNLIESVTLSDIRITAPGGGKVSDAGREVPENPEKYPDFGMFGMLPAYGFYCRHVKNLVLRNVQTGFAQPDHRPALVCDDVEDLELAAGLLTASAEAEAAIRLAGVRNALLAGCRGAGVPAHWVRVTGERTRHVTVTGNHLPGVRQPVSAGPEVPRDAVFLNGNRT